MKTPVLNTILAAALCTGSALHAQEYANRGFMLNLHVGAASFMETAADGLEESGGGAGFAVGWGFTDRTMLYLNGETAEVEYDENVEPDNATYEATTADLGVRVSFGHDFQALRPFLNVAVTGISRLDRYLDVVQDVEYEVETRAFGVTAGAGLQWYFARRFAFDGSLQVTTAAYSEVEVDGDTEELESGIPFTHVRLLAGVSWHP